MEKVHDFVWQLGHGDDGDPERHDGGEEITELQHLLPNSLASGMFDEILYVDQLDVTNYNVS
jgi:hypothetical protein